MCGRYRLNRGWERDLQATLPFVSDRLGLLDAFDADRVDVRPTDPMPVLRLDAGRPTVDVRRWGFLRLMPGTPDRRTGRAGKPVRKQLFNAKSETAPVLRAFRAAFAKNRCLIPLSSWFEWPERAGAGTARKQKVEIAPRDGGTLLAAGLWEVSTAFDGAHPVDTFTMLTTSPTAFLGTVHDRAPLIVPAAWWRDWLEGSATDAAAMTGVPPDSSAYVVRDIEDDRALLFA